MKTIKDVEAQVEEKVVGVLRELDVLPDGYTCSVRFHSKSRAKNSKSRAKNRTASFERTWSPDRDSINIHFERNPEPPQADSQPVAQGKATIVHANPTPLRDDPISDLIRALEGAESR